MVTSELISYIQKELKKNTPIDAIHGVLVRQGWKEESINEGLRLALQDKALLNKALHMDQDQDPAVFPSSWGLLKSTISELKQRYKVYILIVSAPLLFSLFTQLVMYFVGVNIKNVETLVKNNSAFLVVLIMWIIIFGMILFLVQTWSSAALIVAIRDRYKSINFRESYSKALEYLWPLVLVVILNILLSLLGLIAFIIPFMIMIIWFCLSGFVVIGEGLHGFAALKRSKQLVKGKWWKVYWKLSYIGIITLFISLIASFFLELIPLPLIKVLGKSIVNSITTPIMVIYMYLLYEKLRDLV